MKTSLGTSLAAVATFALFGFSGCSKPPASPAAEVQAGELKLANGHLIQNGASNRFTGFMIEKYSGGQLKSRSSVSNGLLWGLSEGWHSNGQLQVREEFRAGLSEGLRVKWETNGAKLSEATTLGGKLNGSFRRWHPNGVLAEEVEMKDDQPDGRARAWYPSGALKAEMRTARGNVVEQKRWADGDVPASALARATESP
jgi:antitoxin component YwqK of YwqJK toxin-antitoxin module